MSEELRAWKDEEFDGAGMPNPAGRIDLSSLTGGDPEVSTWPCAFGTTVVLSCSPTCASTMWRGTCAVSTVGCCKFTPMPG